MTTSTEPSTSSCTTTTSPSPSCTPSPGPRPLVLCGPSGAGKSTLVRRLMEEHRQSFGFSVSHTTRAPREGEVDGVAYNFVTKVAMKEAVGRGEFIEHATFAGNMYGTSAAAVATVRDQGLICLLDIDVQGVQSIKATDIQANYVFVTPPSLEVLRSRLAGRGTETEESLARRLEAAVGDMAFGEAGANFDTVIVNEELEIAYSAFLAFVREKYPGLG